jgi:two-component system, NarL family, sensor histidine kinase UhpB
MAASLSADVKPVNHAKERRATDGEGIDGSYKNVDAQGLQDALDQERLEIANDIHDQLSAEATTLRLRLTKMSRTIDHLGDGVEISGLKEDIKAAIATANSIYRAGRAVVNRLKPELLDTIGLAAAIRSLVADCASANHQCAYSYNVHGDAPHLDYAHKLAVYRIAQEGLTNVAKHSNAEACCVELKLNEHEVVLTVTDDGKGFASSDIQRGHGLGSMHNRAAAHGGKLKIKSDIQAGTLLVASLPIGSQSNEVGHDNL